MRRRWKCQNDGAQVQRAVARGDGLAPQIKRVAADKTMDIEPGEIRHRQGEKADAESANRQTTRHAAAGKSAPCSRSARSAERADSTSRAVSPEIP